MSWVQQVHSAAVVARSLPIGRFYFVRIQFAYALHDAYLILWGNISNVPRRVSFTQYASLSKSQSLWGHRTLLEVSRDSSPLGFQYEDYT